MSAKTPRKASKPATTSILAYKPAKNTPSKASLRALGKFAHAENLDQAATVTVYGTATILSVGASTVWGLIRAGEIDALHIGRRILVTVPSIHAFIARRLAKPLLPPRKGKRGFNRANAA